MWCGQRQGRDADGRAVAGESAVAGGTVADPAGLAVGDGTGERAGEPVVPPPYIQTVVRWTCVGAIRIPATVAWCP